MPLEQTITAPEGETTVHIDNDGAVLSKQAINDASFDFSTLDSANNDDFSLADDGSIPKQNTLDSPTITIPLLNPSPCHQ